MFNTIGIFRSSGQITFNNAIEYNDYIINQQNLIVERIDAYISNISDGDKNSTLVSLKELIKTIDQSLINLKNIGPYESNSAFRDAAIDLFEFYKSVAMNEYNEIVDIRFKEELTDEDYNRLQEIVDQISAKEKLVDDKFINSQKAFANEFGFILSTSSDKKQNGQYTEPNIQKGMPVNSLNVVRLFLEYMIDGDQDNMKELISPDFKKKHNLQKKSYRVNNYGLKGFVVFAYDNAKKQFTAHIWGDNKSWVHELTFVVEEIKGKWYIVPSSFDGEWVDPWTSVRSYINE